MRILSWNIQSTKGCDQQFDIHRIINDIEAFGDLDVICLQEVARNMDAYNGDDQKEILEQHFGHYHLTWASGFSRPLSDGTYQEFGNITLVKHGLLLDRRNHLLPSPYVAPRLQMPRTLVETVIAYQDTSITLFNTHLAYHDKSESRLQMDYISQLRDVILKYPPPVSISPKENQDAFHCAHRGEHVVLCGDLNIASTSPEYKQQILEMSWVDYASIIAEKTTENLRKPTCGLYDTKLWPEGAHVRDYFLGTPLLAKQLKDILVNTQTSASDHQPILLILQD